MLVLSAIEENSKRLYLEALDALDAERFATAVALSIFSIEEAAKYVILKRQFKRPELPKKHVFRHEVKHEEIGEFFWYWAIFSVLTKTFEDFNSFTSTLPDPDPKIVEMVQGFSPGDAVNFLRYNMFDDEDEMRAYVRANFPHPEFLDVATAGATGKIETIRRKALYVDPSPQLNSVLSSPSSIGNTEATEWLTIAWFGQEYMKLGKRLWNEI